MTDPLHSNQKQFTAEEYQTTIRFLEYNIEHKIMSSSQMALMEHLLCEARNRLRELFNDVAGGEDE